MKPTIAIALSGGVDSMMAAFLLKSQGYQVLGIHFLTGFEPAGSNWASRDKDIHPIHRVAEQLQIPVSVLDCSVEFRTCVVDYFTRTYMYGQTPNPCAVCNPRIKFGAIREHAKELGAAYLATGHYARIAKNTDGTCRLFRGADPGKDQSYFLARLTQDQLQQALFPLGDLFKKEVKARARQNGLKPAAHLESQDVCFIRETEYADFLEAQPGFKAAPGEIVDVRGKVIGEHQGLHRFTIGQRRGINCPAPEPYYVVRLDTRANRLVVGSKIDGLVKKCVVSDVNWIVAAPGLPTEVRVRVRYRHMEVPARISSAGSESVRVEFETAQSAVTPGQAAVFYDNDEVIGGGFIAAKRE